MSDRIEEQPYDDRHNTPPKPRFDAELQAKLGQDVTGLNQAAMERIPSMAEGGPASFWTQSDHIGNDHQESGKSVVEETGVFQPVERFRFRDDVNEMPRRPLIHPHVAEHGIPAFGAGLNWLASVQSPVRTDLVNFDWAQSRAGVIPGPEVSNIELRTIYAHLIEAATRLRVEMRERGMQVDL